MRVSDLARAVLQVLHGFLERFAPAGIVVGHFAERLKSKHGRHMVEQPAREHRRGEIAPHAVGRVNFLAQPDDLLKSKLSRCERTQFGKPTVGYDRHPICPYGLFCIIVKTFEGGFYIWKERVQLCLGFVCGVDVINLNVNSIQMRCSGLGKKWPSQSLELDD